MYRTGLSMSFSGLQNSTNTPQEASMPVVVEIVFISNISILTGVLRFG
jgi:hypothetical protein